MAAVGGSTRVCRLRQMGREEADAVEVMFGGYRASGCGKGRAARPPHLDTRSRARQTGCSRLQPPQTPLSLDLLAWHNGSPTDSHPTRSSHLSSASSSVPSSAPSASSGENSPPRSSSLRAAASADHSDRRLASRWSRPGRWRGRLSRCGCCRSRGIPCRFPSLRQRSTDTCIHLVSRSQQHCVCACFAT